MAEKKTRRSFFVELLTKAAGTWLALTGIGALAGCPVAAKYGGPPPGFSQPEKYGGPPDAPPPQAPDVGAEPPPAPAEKYGGPPAEPPSEPEPAPVTKYGGPNGEGW